MRTGTNSHLSLRGLFANSRQRNGITISAQHKERIQQEMLRSGVSKLGLMRSASQHLPTIIHADEHVGGVVYGRGETGSVMIAATDKRVIYLDKKPLYINEDEMTYDVVGGVSYSHAGPGSTVTLHTRIKDYTIHTLNARAAEIFIQYVESRCLERSRWGAGQ